MEWDARFTRPDTLVPVSGSLLGAINKKSPAIIFVIPRLSAEESLKGTFIHHAGLMAYVQGIPRFAQNDRKPREVGAPMPLPIAGDTFPLFICHSEAIGRGIP